MRIAAAYEPESGTIFQHFGRTAAAPTMPLPDAMSEKPAAPITEAPSTTGRSLILPTTAGSPWNLSAERA